MVGYLITKKKYLAPMGIREESTIKMLNLREIARNQTVVSILMEGRQKVDTDYVIANYKKGFVIDKVDIVNSNEDRYPVFTFKEDDSIFYCGGLVLGKIVDAWLEASGGSLSDVNAALQEENVKIKLEMSKTKDRNNFVKVQVL